MEFNFIKEKENILNIMFDNGYDEYKGLSNVKRTFKILSHIEGILINVFELDTKTIHMKKFKTELLRLEYTNIMYTANIFVSSIRNDEHYKNVFTNATSYEEFKTYLELRELV